MTERVDYDAAADEYRRTRTVGPNVLDAWHVALRPLFGTPGQVVADIGAGTGQFAAPIARWFDARVIAIEPSRGMREKAPAHHGVHYVAGRAEELPLASGSIQRVWLSAVVHHLADIHTAMREVRRVLAPDGVALIRGFFADVAPPEWFTAFPGIERSISTFPASSDVTDAVAAAGMRATETIDVTETHEVDNPWEPGLRALRTADSLLRPLTDAEFESGVAALSARLPRDADAVVHTATLRLIVASRQ